MNVGIRAARDQTAMDRIVTAAGVLGGRFSVPLDTDSIQRHHRDPLVKALFTREGVADFLDALVTATDPGESLPNQADVVADMTLPEIKARIAAADAETLDAIEDAEDEGKQRKGVFEALDRRREQLEAEMEPETTAPPATEEEPVTEPAPEPDTDGDGDDENEAG